MKRLLFENSKDYIDVVAELHVSDEPGDPWNLSGTRHEEWFSVDFMLVAGDRRGRASMKDYHTDRAYFDAHGLPEYAKACINFRKENGKTMCLLVPEDIADELAETIESAKAEARKSFLHEHNRNREQLLPKREPRQQSRDDDGGFEL